jgi:hypothetical protein
MTVVGKWRRAGDPYVWERRLGHTFYRCTKLKEMEGGFTSEKPAGRKLGIR